MKIYLVSLGTGVLVGVIYGLLQVRSPAPPLIALLGLLGMLFGEQVIPVSRTLIDGSGFLHMWPAPGPTERPTHHHDGEFG